MLPLVQPGKVCFVGKEVIGVSFLGLFHCEVIWNLHDIDGEAQFPGKFPVLYHVFESRTKFFSFRGNIRIGDEAEDDVPQSEAFQH